MRQVVKDFAAIVSGLLPIEEPVYEFGALRVAGQEEFADLRPLFAGKEYVGADMREGLGVDKVLDLHTIDLPDASVGTVLCLDTLEHVEYPHTAMREIHRILKPNGIAVISSVMLFRIHAYPYDYWRFTPEAFRSLLKPFTSAFVGYAGEENFPHTVVGVGFKAMGRYWRNLKKNTELGSVSFTVRQACPSARKSGDCLCLRCFPEAAARHWGFERCRGGCSERQNQN